MASAAKSGTFDQLIERIEGTPRARIINGLRFYGGEHNAKELRRDGDIPSGIYHFEELEKKGLIEKTGEEFAGRGGTSATYRLTNRGQKIADELADSSGRVTAAELEEEVEELQNELERLGKLYNQLADHVEKIDERTLDE
ncbi:hypothetical protein [Halocatena marina]|uniref:hypothetical protein n=1 Tax=Halocatena marina TaxID=2934937 RepID=UPI00200C0EBF|nr:hypothetical protein [Halocatena marina]